jgi:hypothetical protein
MSPLAATADVGKGSSGVAVAPAILTATGLSLRGAGGCGLPVWTRMMGWTGVIGGK